MKGIVKLLTVLCAVCLLFSIAACSSTTPAGTTSPSAATAKDAEGMVFGLSINNIDDYQTRNIKYITEFAEKRGAKIVYTDARGNVEKQISDIESLITQQVDAIWFQALDPNGLVPGVDKAVAAKIPIVEGHYGINSDKCFSIGTRQQRNGQLQYEYVSKYLDANPDVHLNICYLWGFGPTMQGDTARHDTFFELLEKNYKGRYTVLAEEIADYNVEKAITVAEDWTVAFPQMNAIICQSDEMATGVVNVIKSHSLDISKIIICGIDSSRDLSEPYLEEGSLDASTFTDLKMLGEVTVDYLVKMAKDGFKMTESIYVDKAQHLVTGENCDEVWRLVE